MAKHVQQFRFYSNTAANVNYPREINYRNLSSGSIFANYMPITQLGIQSLPGTKFYLNNSEIPVIIGHTGIYELDLSGLSEITALRFDPKSLMAIDGNQNSFLIVDIIYEKEGNV